MNGPLPDLTVLGSRIHFVRKGQAARWMDGVLQKSDGHCRLVVVTGFHGLWKAHSDLEFRSAVNAADLWVPDGIAPVWIARLKGIRHAERIPGAELMDAFFRMANDRGYSSFFYGDSDATLSALRDRLQQEYPGHRVVGTFSPPFRQLSQAEEAAHVDMINRAAPDVLWVGLGLPKQEMWIGRNLHRLHVPLAVGVGAAFKFLAGTVQRAPQWVGRMGLEWLWRLAHEPKKCWRRCLVDGPQFLFHVGLELSGIRKYGAAAESAGTGHGT